jgi:hypothetical protein
VTTVVNKNKEPYDIYCGRGSIWGNPYVIGKDGNRAEVIERYKEWFSFLIRDPLIKNELFNLRNKTLGCFCKPLSCHCDIIADYLNKLDTSKCPVKN